MAYQLKSRPYAVNTEYREENYILLKMRTWNSSHYT